MDAGGWLMRLRRLFAGLVVVFGLSLVWALVRPTDKQAHARTADPVVAAEPADEAGGGNFDDAAHRYRSGQSRHWRQVMIGGH
jgi:hypothetical protein